MAYPPANHYLSDLGFRLAFDGEASRVFLDVEPAQCGVDGGVLLGVLATAIDLAGGSLSRRQAAPDWVATSDIAIDLVEPIVPGPARVDCRLGRRGRGLVALDLDLSAGDGEGATRRGLASAAFAVLPDRGREQGGRPVPAAGDRESAAVTVSTTYPRSPRGALALHQRLGIRVVDGAAGVVEIALDDYVRNTFGALQGGVAAVLGEAAILAATGGPLTALAVRYRTLGRVGPFRTAVEVLSSDGRRVARAVVRDQGAGGAVVAVATGRSAREAPSSARK